VTAGKPFGRRWQHQLLQNEMSLDRHEGEEADGGLWQPCVGIAKIGKQPAALFWKKPEAGGFCRMNQR